MHESLRKIAAELALLHVELLGEEARGSTGRPAALEGSHRRDQVVLLQSGQGHGETAQLKGAFGLTKWALVRLEAVHVAIGREVFPDRSQREEGARIVWSGGTVKRRQQQCGVHPFVLR